MSENVLEFKIEKGFPIPKRINRDGSTDFLRKLRVGDSSSFEKGKKYSSWHTLARNIGIKICIRVDGEDESRIRIWRVE